MLQSTRGLWFRGCLHPEPVDFKAAMQVPQHGAVPCAVLSHDGLPPGARPGLRWCRSHPRGWAESVALQERLT